ncbi:MAG: hypothetical protein ACJ0P4_04600 [Flavobacteriaceae bacterium]|tara:strand:- start:64 stop:549 length:486 start_codon:yes stop_codon:yes gene_type:complete
MKKLLLLSILLSSAFSFAQEITGTTRTQDKYSKAMREINEGYLKNDFSAFDNYFSVNGNYTINGTSFTLKQVREGFSSDHIFFKNIKMPQSFVETTFYDENNNNQVWSHYWGIVESTSKRTNKNEAIPVNISFKWVDGKVVSASWIFDPTIKIQEIMASQK